MGAASAAADVGALESDSVVAGAAASIGSLAPEATSSAVGSLVIAIGAIAADAADAAGIDAASDGDGVGFEAAESSTWARLDGAWATSDGGTDRPSVEMDGAAVWGWTVHWGAWCCQHPPLPIL